MDWTLVRSRRFTRGFMIALGAPMDLLVRAAGAAAEPAGVRPAQAPDCAQYQGAVWALIAVLLLQSIALALLLRRASRRREREALLRASEERFRMLAENSLVASYLIDQDGIIR